MSDFGTLRFERDMIDVTSSSPEPDKAWRYPDRAGHKHRWDDRYSTLVEVVDDTYWCEDCGDHHTDSHLECPICGEAIEPGSDVPSQKSYLPGLVSYYLDDEPITEERYRALASERGMTLA